MHLINKKLVFFLKNWENEVGLLGLLETKGLFLSLINRVGKRVGLGMIGKSWEELGKMGKSR